MTPIGSLILGMPGQEFYFEKFPQHLPQNLEINKQVCILVVNSSRWFWFLSLVAGKFSRPSAVRLRGVAGVFVDSIPYTLFSRFPGVYGLFYRILECCHQCGG